MLLEPTLLEFSRFEDDRGYFQELFRQSRDVADGDHFKVSQINFSKSDAGVLRGLHFSVPEYPQQKLVHVLSGAIVDVVVNLRQPRTSAAFSSFKLRHNVPQALLVPHGYAHGFLATSSDTKVIYAVSSEYSPQSERTLDLFDATLNIPWRRWAAEEGLSTDLQISEKDKNQHITLGQAADLWLHQSD